MGDQPEHFTYHNGFHFDENHPLLQDHPNEQDEDHDDDFGNGIPLEIVQPENAIAAQFPDLGQADAPEAAENLGSSLSSNETLNAEFAAEALARADLHNGYTGTPNSGYRHSFTASTSRSTLQDSGEQVDPDVSPDTLLLPTKDGKIDDESELSDLNDSFEISAQVASGNNGGDHEGSDPKEDGYHEASNPPECPDPPESPSYENIELLPRNSRARNASLEGKLSECCILIGSSLALLFVACIVVTALSVEGLIASKYLTWAGVMFCVLVFLLLIVLIATCYLAELEERFSRR